MTRSPRATVPDEQIAAWSAEKERAFRVMEWADLNGNQLEDVLRLDPEDDAETLAIINDALLAAGDAFDALP